MEFLIFDLEGHYYIKEIYLELCIQKLHVRHQVVLILEK